MRITVAAFLDELLTRTMTGASLACNETLTAAQLVVEKKISTLLEEAEKQQKIASNLSQVSVFAVHQTLTPTIPIALNSSGCKSYFRA